MLNIATRLCGVSGKNLVGYHFELYLMERTLSVLAAQYP